MVAFATSHTDDVGDSLSDASSSSFELALKPNGGFHSTSLSAPPEDQVACYFPPNHVLQPTNFMSGYLSYLPSLYVKRRSNSPLVQIITSLGMAGLANVRNAPEAKAVSTYKYTSALRGVNAMLQDPARAIEDETLITILLLSLYEVSTIRHTDNIIFNVGADIHRSQDTVNPSLGGAYQWCYGIDQPPWRGSIEDRNWTPAILPATLSDPHRQPPPQGCHT